jgi:hypothetical protein
MATVMRSQSSPEKPRTQFTWLTVLRSIGALTHCVYAQARSLQIESQTGAAPFPADGRDTRRRDWSRLYIPGIASEWSSGHGPETAF